MTYCGTSAVIFLLHDSFVVFDAVRAFVFVFDEQARGGLQLACAIFCACVTQIDWWNAFSMRNPASSEIMSASVLLWDTAVCFLQAHEIGTNV